MNYNRHSSFAALECSAFSKIGFHFKGFRNKNITAAGNEMITRKCIAFNNWFRLDTKIDLLRLRIPDSVNIPIILTKKKISIESIPLSK